eukprot:UC4_evm1s1352
MIFLRRIKRAKMEKIMSSIELTWTGTPERLATIKKRAKEKSLEADNIWSKRYSELKEHGERLTKLVVHEMSFVASRAGLRFIIPRVMEGEGRSCLGIHGETLHADSEKVWIPNHVSKYISHEQVALDSKFLAYVASPAVKIYDPLERDANKATGSRSDLTRPPTRATSGAPASSFPP